MFSVGKGKCSNFKVIFLDMYILQIRPFAIRRPNTKYIYIVMSRGLDLLQIQDGFLMFVMIYRVAQNECNYFDPLFERHSWLNTIFGVLDRILFSK